MELRSLTPLYLNETKGVIFINTNGKIQAYDSHAERVLHIPRGKALHALFWDLFEDELFGFSMRQTLSQKQLPPGQFPGAPLNPNLEIEAFFLNLENASPSETSTPTEGVLLLIGDAQELKRRRRIQLRNEHLKELNKMAALVAHEIRNPLGGIKGFAALLKRDLKDQSDLHKLATYIIEGTESLSQLVNQILGYTKPLQIKPEPCNLVRLMEELLLHLNADESIDPRIELHLEASEDEIIAMIDAQSLKSALLNLASNAIHAMPDGGEMRLSISQNAHETQIKISDTGMGIPKENQPKIFSPLFTTRTEGHGFGLMEVHKIIHAHHGEIEFFSKVGQGTTFVIHLPKIAKQEPSLAAL